MSGGGGGGGGSDAVDYQREQDEARQARIRQGMTQLDELFNGKVIKGTPEKLAAERVKTDPYWGTAAGTYYDDNGKQFTFTADNQWRRKGGILTKQNGVDVWTPQNLWTTDPRTGYQAAVPDRIEGGFDDSYMEKRGQAYEDFAMPQLADQYAEQQKALTYALSRGGNLGSSLAAKKGAELDKSYALQQQAIKDTGQNYVNQARQDVTDQKQSLISMLQATADPDATYAQAQAQANSISAMPTFSPLSPVISNVAGGLGTYLQNQQTADAIKRANSGGSYSNSLSQSSGKVG